MNQDAHHLSIGAMTALAQFSDICDDSLELRRHLETCDDCMSSFTYVKNLLSSLRAPNGDECHGFHMGSLCSSDEITYEKQALLLTAFIREDTGEEQARQLLGHVNSCFPCFESLCRNWSDYLNTRRRQTVKQRVTREEDRV